MNIYKISMVVLVVTSILLMLSITYDITIMVWTVFLLYLIYHFFGINNNKKVIVLIMMFLSLILTDMSGENFYLSTLLENTAYSCFNLRSQDEKSLEKLSSIFINRELMTKQIMKCNIKNDKKFLLNNILYRSHIKMHGIKYSPDNYLGQTSYQYLKEKYKLQTKLTEDETLSLYMLNFTDKEEKVELKELQNKLIIEIDKL